MPHWICAVVILSVITENGSGGSSPGCISADQSTVVPSSRGGVPVFNRPSPKPARSNDPEPERRRLTNAAGGPVLLPNVDQARKSRW